VGARSPLSPWWCLLGVLLAATLVASIVWSPGARPPAGEEVTYAMQAASLAWDGDLVYERKDRGRFAEHWGARPDRLVLRDRDDEDEERVYGEPFLYALTVSPFVRLAPVRGAAVANALLLAAAALLAARTLSRRLGPAAPLWVAVFLFASVAFGYVFRVQPDLFLLAATAAGLALAYGGDRSSRWGDEPFPDVYEGEPVTPASRLFARWWAAGLLLAVPGVFHPFYLVLLLPALIAALDTSGRRRWVALAGLLLGAAVLLLLCVGLQPWDESGQVYDVRGASPRAMGEEGDTGLLLHPKLAGWNTVYFLVGQSFGVLPYFLPLFLGFAAYRSERGRWALPLAVLLAAGGFLLTHPFDFQGGEGAIGNRLFLPLYAALWFVAARPARALPALLAAALAAPFLYPLWSHPAAATIAQEGGRGYVAPWVGQWLPYEVTQRDAPGAAFFQNGLWIKLTDPDVWRPGQGDSLRVLGESHASLLAASSRPVEGFQLEFDGKAPARLEVRRTELRPSLLRPDGSLAFDIPAKEKAALPLWWTGGEEYHLYELGFRLPGAPPAPIRFRVLPRRDLIQKSGERDR